MSHLYADPAEPALPATGFKLDLSKAALVVIDPQNDFLSPAGASWAVFGESIVENNTVENLEKLFKAFKAHDLPVAVSPHYYYPHDHDWHFGGPLEKVMHSICMFDRKGPNTLENFEGSGADFLEIYKPYILDGETIIASPHKVYGPETNDLALQLRKKGVSQIILAGMAANLCVESHLRELLEQGFEIVVVRDATAGPRLPDGDGYLAAIINYRFLAHGLWTTEETIAQLQPAGSCPSGRASRPPALSREPPMKIPARYEHFVFGVVQSGLTCAVAAAIATTPHALDLAFAGRWLNAWALSWVSMLPVVVLAAPMIRRVVRRMTVG